MTASPIWLVCRADYYSLYEEVVDLGQGFWPRHNRPVIGFGAITSHLVVPLRSDFQHLRRWRRGIEQAQSYVFKAVITVIVTGFVVAVWLGIKATLGK